MARPSTKKRTAAKPKAKAAARSASLVRLKKKGGLYAVTVNGRVVSKFMPKLAAETKARSLRSKGKPAAAKKPTPKKAVRSRANAKPAAKKKTPAKKTNPTTIRIADILDSNGEQSIKETRKRIKGGFTPKRPHRPITVVRSRSGKYILTDGFHRTALAIEKGRKTIAAVVRRPGGKVWNGLTKKNPGLLGLLADAAVAISGGIQIAEHLRTPKKKRTAAKPKAGKSVRSGSQKKKPAAKKKTAKKNPTAEVTAYRKFHSEGLKAAINYVDKSKDLTAAAKTRIKRELRTYHKPPTIGTRDNPKKKANPKRRYLLTYSVKGSAANTEVFTTKAAADTFLRRLRTRYPNKLEAVRMTSYPGGRAETLPAKPKVKRNHGAYESFQGRKATQTLTPIAGANTPQKGWILGRLIKLVVRGYATLDFETKKFYLWADDGNRCLFIGGGRVTDAVPGMPAGHVLPLGRVSSITYETEKTHLDDPKGQPSWYRHRFGEEGGQEPLLVVDNKGYGYFEEGDYTITPLGIRD